MKLQGDVKKEVKKKTKPDLIVDNSNNKIKMATN